MVNYVIILSFCLSIFLTVNLHLFFVKILWVCTCISLSTGQLDMVVIGTGTGGTVIGIGRKMKEKMPNVKVKSMTHSKPSIICH